jgi:hypothetical protein
MIVKLMKKSKDPWSGVKFYKNCKHDISSYLMRSGRRYTGLDREDQELLERELNFDKGFLRPESPFWDTFKIFLGEAKPELTFDTTIPEDLLKYKHCKNHKDVANGYNDRKPGAQYILIEEQATAEEINKKAKEKIRAIVEYQKMSVEQQRKALRLFGHRTENVSREVIESTLYQLVEEDPGKFNLIWTDNINKEVQFLVEEAVANNIMRKDRSTYKYGTDNIGYSLQETIDYLKNPAHNDIRMSIQSQIEGKKNIVSGVAKSEKKSEAAKLKEEILSESVYKAETK